MNCGRFTLDLKRCDRIQETGGRWESRNETVFARVLLIRVAIPVAHGWSPVVLYHGLRYSILWKDYWVAEDEVDSPFVRIMWVDPLPNPTFRCGLFSYWCSVHEDHSLLLYILHPGPGNIYWLPISSQNSSECKLRGTGHRKSEVIDNVVEIGSFHDEVEQKFIIGKNPYSPRFRSLMAMFIFFVFSIVDLILNKPIPNRGLHAQVSGWYRIPAHRVSVSSWKHGPSVIYRTCQIPLKEVHHRGGFSLREQSHSQNLEARL